LEENRNTKGTLHYRDNGIAFDVVPADGPRAKRIVL